jgi:excisionase family DNA binding protein
LHLDRSGAGAVMRAPGDFQPPQMKCVDSRMGELFSSSPSDDRCSGTNNAASIFVVGARTSAWETAGKLPRPKTSFEKRAYTIKEVGTLIGISRTMIYHAIKIKELRAVKCGHGTMIRVQDLQAWIDAWPPKT